MRSVFGVILVRIYSGLHTKYLSVFSPNAGKCEPELLRIRILFTQCSPCSWALPQSYALMTLIRLPIRNSKAENLFSVSMVICKFSFDLVICRNRDFVKYWSTLSTKKVIKQVCFYQEISNKLIIKVVLGESWHRLQTFWKLTSKFFPKRSLLIDHTLHLIYLLQ